MPLLLREDGIQFAIRSYRETLTIKNKNLLRKEIGLLAENSGQFARFFAKNGDTYEAVFSQDQGYLLGEAAWDYFSNPTDLIFCEALPDGLNAVLVIVRDNSVYLDAELPLESIQDELASLLASSNIYDIYVYGDVPLVEDETKDGFYFPPEIVSSFTQLETSAFDQFVADDSLLLLPIEQAMRDSGIVKPKPIKLILLVIISVLIVWYVWTFLRPMPETKPSPVPVVKAPVKTTEQVPTDPYAQYKDVLRTAGPKDIMQVLTQAVYTMSSIPGWIPLDYSYDDQSQIQISLKPLDGASYNNILAWGNTMGMSFNISNQKADVNVPTNLTNRNPGNIVFLQNVQSIMADVIDAVSGILDNANPVNIGETAQQQNFRSIAMTISFTNVAPSTLLLLGKALNDFPITIQSIKVTSDSDHLLSGTIQLTAVGK